MQRRKVEMRLRVGSGGGVEREGRHLFWLGEEPRKAFIFVG